MSRNAWPAIEAEERAKAEQVDRVWDERQKRIYTTVRWVSVMDEWPEPHSMVLVSRDVAPTVWPAYTDGKSWFDACDCAILSGVTHWCEFPMGPTP